MVRMCLTPSKEVQDRTSVSEMFSVEPVNERTERCFVEESKIGSAIQGGMRSSNTSGRVSWNVLLGAVL